MTPKDEFLTNLKIAARLLSPTVHADGIRLDPKYLENLLRRSTIWLTPRVVEGFDIKVFSELTHDARRTLESQVERFQAVAKRAPRRAPAPTELVDEALPAFLKILETVQPYLDEYAAYPILKQAPLPDDVTDFAIKAGLDSSGDPALWVWVIIKDEAADSNFSEKYAAAIREASHNGIGRRQD